MKNNIFLTGVYGIDKRDDVFLLELIIDAFPKDVDVSTFTQRDDKLPRDSWQAPYDEHYLNEDGTSVIGMFGDQDKLDGEKTRIAFFMYSVDLGKPLISQFGEISLGAVSVLPERLAKIIQFEPID